MTTSTIQNEAILASAGFGKTYQLAHRYIKLLACGSKPDQICAVTFSRKAAGEIFDSVVLYLHRAASHPSHAKQTARDIDMPQLEQKDFLRLLRAFLNELHRDHIGTLDSFTVSIIRAFPLELGISPNLQLMDNGGSAARVIRHQVLARIFNHRYVSGQARTDFHEAYKQATFGRQEKRLVEILDDFIAINWDNYQALPDANAWGNPDRIWAQPSPWLQAPSSPLEIAQALKDLLEGHAFSKQIHNGLFKAIDAMAEHGPTKPWSRAHDSTVIERLLAIPNILEADKAAIHYYKDITFSKEECHLWAALLRNLVATEINKSLRQSNGIARILEQYQLLYDPIRRGGQMTFSDAQILLTGANSVSGGLLASRDPVHDGRLYIDYRLDCTLDHWLIDEFQDTSDLQWDVIQNLVDEVMQDSTGRRSFFYVGDVKQAVHGWRGGNATLFGQVQRHYQIPLVKKEKSFRSCQAVLDTVNRVFEDLPAARYPASLVETWKAIWVHHDPEPAVVPKTGYTSIMTAIPTGEKDKSLPEDRFKVVAGILNEIDPITKGLSVAVLVRTNEAGKTLVNQLRSDCPNIPICHEGRAQIVDNPIVALLLSLIKFAAHPGDTFAWRHVQMSPLSRHLAKHELTRDTLPLVLLKEIHHDGFEHVVRRWGARLKLKKTDAFGRKRLDDLAAAAAAFDQTASRDAGAFLDYVTDHEVEESGTQQTVKVMTIHKSKGLTFDLVILPELERSDTGRVDLALPRDPDTNEPLWALKLPRKVIAERDDVLASIRSYFLELDQFEELCVLYVGLTRARYATYMVVNPENSDSSAASLLVEQLTGPDRDAPPSITLGHDTFTCLQESGDRDWSAGLKAPEKREVLTLPELPDGYAKKRSTRKRLTRIEPSSERIHRQPASRLFDQESHEVMDFGSAIHELLEKVEWIESVDPKRIVESWKPSRVYDEQVKRDVTKQFLSCLENPEVTQHLAKPDGTVELWREKRFEVVLKQGLIAGAFDRVTILKDSNGTSIEASILDYKSSRADTPERIQAKIKDYRPQMTTYRSALAKILGLPEKKIALYLLFTRRGVLQEID